MSGSLLSLLMRFVSGRKPWHAVPFSLKVKKTTWSVATDSHVLFAVKMAGATARKDYPKELEEMLTAEVPANATELDVSALKVWAGDTPSALVPAGDVDYEHHGVLMGQAIDRRKLAYLFAKITLPKVRAWVVQPGLIAFENPQSQWRAFLSGLGGELDGQEPVFPPPAGAEPKSVFDLVNEVGTE